MNCKRVLSLALVAVIGLGSTTYAQTTSKKSSRSTAIWTAAGAGAGFGIGLTAGLNKYDDAINSDRKVWTSAIVGAAIGAAGGYLISRLRNRARPAPATKYRSDPTYRSHPHPALRSFR